MQNRLTFTKDITEYLEIYAEKISKCLGLISITLSLNKNWKFIQKSPEEHIQKVSSPFGNIKDLIHLTSPASRQNKVSRELKNAILD